MISASHAGRLPRVRHVGAVIAREIGSRFTGDPLGYGWAYLTPLAWIAVIYVVFVVLGRTTPLDADVGSFILSGIMPYLAFRYQVSSVLRAKSTYRAVMTLPSVTPETVYFSIIVLEYYNSLTIYLALLLLNYLLFGHFYVDDPLRVLWGFTLASATGAALGYALAGINTSASTLLRISSTALRPLFYLSAVFYTADELPQSWLDWLSWNPLLHAVEIVRSGSFGDYESRVASGLMPITFIVLCLLLGWFLSARASAVAPADQPYAE